MFFMLTGELISSKTKKHSRSEVEQILNTHGLSPEATDLIKYLTNEKNRVTDSRGNVFSLAGLISCFLEIKIFPFFTKDYMKAAVIFLLKFKFTTFYSVFKQATLPEVRAMLSVHLFGNFRLPHLFYFRV
jgi:NADH:ubiquinone oxidoreductase subunit H